MFAFLGRELLGVGQNFIFCIWPGHCPFVGLVSPLSLIVVHLRHRLYRMTSLLKTLQWLPMSPEQIQRLWAGHSRTSMVLLLPMFPDPSKNTFARKWWCILQQEQNHCTHYAAGQVCSWPSLQGTPSSPLLLSLLWLSAQLSHLPPQPSPKVMRLLVCAPSTLCANFFLTTYHIIL